MCGSSSRTMTSNVSTPTSAFVSHDWGRISRSSFARRCSSWQRATDERDLYNLRGLRLEKLSGTRSGQHSVRLNDQFRLILRFDTDKEGRLVVIVELTDYH